MLRFRVEEINRNRNSGKRIVEIDSVFFVDVLKMPQTKEKTVYIEAECLACWAVDVTLMPLA
jgi:hypothetical protein